MKKPAEGELEEIALFSLMFLGFGGMLIMMAIEHNHSTYNLITGYGLGGTLFAIGLWGVIDCVVRWWKLKDD